MEGLLAWEQPRRRGSGDTGGKTNAVMKSRGDWIEMHFFTNSSSFPKSALLEINLGQQREAEEKWSVLQSHSSSEKKKKKYRSKSGFWLQGRFYETSEKQGEAGRSTEQPLI